MTMEEGSHGRDGHEKVLNVKKGSGLEERQGGHCGCSSVVRVQR